MSHIRILCVLVFQFCTGCSTLIVYYFYYPASLYNGSRSDHWSTIMYRHRDILGITSQFLLMARLKKSTTIILRQFLENVFVRTEFADRILFVRFLCISVDPQILFFFVHFHITRFYIIRLV